MALEHTGSGRPFRRDVEKWKHVGGGTDADSSPVSEPWVLTRARIIDDLCQRYSCLPSQLLAEDAANIFPILEIRAAAGDFDVPTR